jgi:hypothetical protein
MGAEYSTQPEREDGLFSAHLDAGLAAPAVMARPPDRAIDGPDPVAPDEAIDAIVYDVHPALQPRLTAGTDFYPYAARPAYLGPAYEPNSSHPSIFVQLRSFLSPHLDAPAAAQYVVPRRFGMSAILGIITALAVLFGWFHWSEAHPVQYLFFGVEALLICLAQMFYGQTPRAASAAAGAIILPIFLIAAALFSDSRMGAGIFCFLFMSVPAGAFLGYITGTMAAGVFLVMDAADAYFTGSRDLHSSPSNPSAASAP